MKNMEKLNNIKNRNFINKYETKFIKKKTKVIIIFCFLIYY